MTAPTASISAAPSISRSPTADGVESRRARIYGGRDWVRLGAVELGLDCLRRYLHGLPVTERTDFERSEQK